MYNFKDLESNQINWYYFNIFFVSYLTIIVIDDGLELPTNIKRISKLLLY